MVTLDIRSGRRELVDWGLGEQPPGRRDATFLKALMTGAVERVEKNRLEADPLIRSDLGSIGMTDVRADMPLVETGYRETHRLLEALSDTDRSRFFREDRVEPWQAAQ